MRPCCVRGRGTSDRRRQHGPSDGNQQAGDDPGDQERRDRRLKATRPIGEHKSGDGSDCESDKGCDANESRESSGPLRIVAAGATPQEIAKKELGAVTDQQDHRKRPDDRQASLALHVARHAFPRRPPFGHHPRRRGHKPGKVPPDGGDPVCSETLGWLDGLLRSGLFRLDPSTNLGVVQQLHELLNLDRWRRRRLLSHRGRRTSKDQQEKKACYDTPQTCTHAIAPLIASPLGGDSGISTPTRHPAMPPGA